MIEAKSDVVNKAEPVIAASRPDIGLAPLHSKVLGMLVTVYPDSLALDDLRKMMGAHATPREALLILAERGLVRAVNRDDDRRWRATRAGLEAVRGRG